MSTFSVLLIILLWSICNAQRAANCKNPVRVCKKSTNYFPRANRIKIAYAKKTIRNLKYTNTYVDFTVRGLGSSFFQYRFVVCGCSPGTGLKGRQVLYIDPKALYVNEGPTLALFGRIASNLNALKYVTSAKFIYSPAVRDRVRRGSTRDIAGAGFSTNFDRLKNDPLLSASIIGAFGATSYRAARTGVPFLVVAETQEANALARAEWMKIIGLLVNRAGVANSLFKSIERKYEAVRQRARRAQRRPSVFFNYPVAAFPPSGSSLDKKYNWFLPVKDQYITDLILDANADYRYSADRSGATRSATLSQIKRDFKSARFLIQSSRFPGSSSLTLENYMSGLVNPGSPDKKFRDEMAKFAAVRCGNVWGHQRRLSPDGQADDFFASAAFRPDLVLSDFVKILHPNLARGARFTYVYNYRAKSKRYTNNCPYDVLEGKPPRGKVFFDKKFIIPGLSRFAVEDRLDDRVLPRIRSALTGSPRIELFFATKDQKRGKTIVTVRTLIDMRSTTAFRRSKAVLMAMKATLGNRIRQVG